MLKRQRAPSPTPYSSSLPLVSGPSPLEKMHDTKRRRVQPPVLDGRFRGWNDSPSSLYDDPQDKCDDNGEEDFSDDNSPNTSADSPYKTANNFLHELHTLHRHRLFSPPQSFLMDRRTSTSTSNLPGHQPDHHTLGHTFRNSPQGKQVLPTTPVQLRRQQNIESEVNTGMPGEHVSAEVQSVKQRYEDTNRLLGSLFLSRRRELGYGTNDTGTER